jgi:choline kinase
LECLQALKVPTWATNNVSLNDTKITKVSGSLTNAVFFVSTPGCPTLLLRIYGASSSSLISRPRELQILHVLSSRYQIGPKIYGTFQNGRVEEYFHSTTLTAKDIRNPDISRWIGARMAELHSVDIEAVEGPDWEIGAKKNVRSWLQPAKEVTSLPAFKGDVGEQLDLDGFKDQWKRYLSWLSKHDNQHTGSQRVFAHNDTQYGNLLRLQHPKAALDAHRQVGIIYFVCTLRLNSLTFADHCC